MSAFLAGVVLTIGVLLIVRGVGAADFWLVQAGIWNLIVALRLWQTRRG